MSSDFDNFSWASWASTAGQKLCVCVCVLTRMAQIITATRRHAETCNSACTELQTFWWSLITNPKLDHSEVICWAYKSLRCKLSDTAHDRLLVPYNAYPGFEIWGRGLVLLVSFCLTTKLTWNFHCSSSHKEKHPPHPPPQKLLMGFFFSFS